MPNGSSGPPLALETALLAAGCRIAFKLLLQAQWCAADCSLDIWDFALEVGELRRHGVSSTDLRLLVCKGYAQHGYECLGHGQDNRQFQKAISLRVTDRSCFTLTPAGLVAAQRVWTSVPVPLRNFESRLPEKPKYDSILKELRFGEDLVKRFRQPAPNQELILRAFEEEGWPPHLDDPLPPTPYLEPKRRLHDAINCLNRNQKQRLLKFLGAGDGRGVLWERFC